MKLESIELNYLVNLIEKDMIDLCLGWEISEPLHIEKSILEFDKIFEISTFEDRDARASEASRIKDEYLFRVNLREELKNTLE